jgi:hypothetical protein
MKMTLNFYQFMDNLPDSRKEQFSYEGWKAIFEHIENIEEETGIETEFDPIAICCEFTEYKDLGELQSNYSNIKDMDDLENQTQVVYIAGNNASGEDPFIIRDY